MSNSSFRLHLVVFSSKMFISFSFRPTRIRHRYEIKRMRWEGKVTRIVREVYMSSMGKT
jgi:hypothetical protein